MIPFGIHVNTVKAVMQVSTGRGVVHRWLCALNISLTSMDKVVNVTVKR